MAGLTPLFVLAALTAGILAAITVWSRRRVKMKVVAIAAAALFIPLAYGGFTDLMSKPKPIALEWRYGDLAEATVIAASMREDEAIYLWLQIEGVDEPRAYTLPWSRPAAEQLQKATREAEENQTEVRAQLPFNSDMSAYEELFYATPQEVPAAKNPAPQTPLIYAQPTESGD